MLVASPAFERNGVLATCVRRVIFKGVSIECEAQSRTRIFEGQSKEKKKGAGADIRYIQTLVRHKSLQTKQIYTLVANKDLNN